MTDEQLNNDLDDVVDPSTPTNPPDELPSDESQVATEEVEDDSKVVKEEELTED